MTDIPFVCEPMPCPKNISYLIGEYNQSLEVYYVMENVAFWKVPQLILLVILLICIVCGNVCVLVGISLSENGYKSRMNFFIINLSIADLAVGLFFVTVDIAEKGFEVWHGGQALCKVVRFLQVLVLYASSFMIVALSIDRVDAIARPMNFSRKATTIRALVNTAWIVSCVLAIPSVLIFDVHNIQGSTYCSITFEKDWYWQVYITLVAVLAFILPALIIITCYSIIMFVVWDKGREFNNTQSSACRNCHQTIDGGNKGIIPQAKIKTLKMTLIIVCVFVSSWCPYFVFNLIDVYRPGHVKTHTEMAVTSLFQSLAPLNSAANPIVYGIFGTRICKHLKKLPCIKHINDWFCQCRSKTSNNEHVNGIQPNHTEHTCAEGTSVRCFPSKFRTSSSKRFLLNPDMNCSLTKCCQSPIGKNAKVHKRKHSLASKQMPKIVIQRECHGCQNKTHEKTQENDDKPQVNVSLQNRRPSGFPLVNRRMTPNDVIMLETYRCSPVSSGEVSQASVISCVNGQTQSVLKVSNVCGNVSKV